MQLPARILLLLAVLSLSATLPNPAVADNFYVAPFTPEITKALKYAPLPHYPESLQRGERFGSHTQDREISGLRTAIFRLTFDASGKVSHIKVLQRTGIAAYDNACLEVLGKWLAYPGQLKELVVPVSFVIYSFRFQPASKHMLVCIKPDSGAAAPGSSPARDRKEV